MSFGGFHGLSDISTGTTRQILSTAPHWINMTEKIWKWFAKILAESLFVDLSEFLTIVNYLIIGGTLLGDVKVRSCIDLFVIDTL